MKCPVCKNETFDNNDFEYQICEECFWEYDIFQVENADFQGGANKQSLNEYKMMYDRLKKTNPNFSCKNISDRELVMSIINKMK